MLVYGECECFVMLMLYVCVLCASCGSSQCCVLHDFLSNVITHFDNSFLISDITFFISVKSVSFALHLLQMNINMDTSSFVNCM